MTAALDVPGVRLRVQDLMALRETARGMPGCRADAPSGAVLLVADFRPSMLGGMIRAFRSVAAAEALVLLGWQAFESGRPVGLLALGAGAPVTIAPRQSMAAISVGLVRAHEDAAAYGLAGRLDDPPLGAALAPLDRLTAGVGDLVIASGFEMSGGGLPAKLLALASCHALHLLHVTDGGPGTEAPNLPGLPFHQLDASLPPEATSQVLGGLLG